MEACLRSDSGGSCAESCLHVAFRGGTARKTSMQPDWRRKKQLKGQQDIVRRRRVRMQPKGRMTSRLLYLARTGKCRYGAYVTESREPRMEICRTLFRICLAQCGRHSFGMGGHQPGLNCQLLVNALSVQRRFEYLRDCWRCVRGIGRHQASRSPLRNHKRSTSALVTANAIGII